jgi:hypothetical protein
LKILGQENGDESYEKACRDLTLKRIEEAGWVLAPQTSESILLLALWTREQVDPQIRDWTPQDEEGTAFKWKLIRDFRWVLKNKYTPFTSEAWEWYDRNILRVAKPSQGGERGLDYDGWKQKLRRAVRIKWRVTELPPDLLVEMIEHCEGG